MDVLDVIKNNDKICNYLDIPLQHISDNILKSMRRGSNGKKINDLIKSFREKIAVEKEADAKRDRKSVV